MTARSPAFSEPVSFLRGRRVQSAFWCSFVSFVLFHGPYNTMMFGFSALRFDNACTFQCWCVQDEVACTASFYEIYNEQVRDLIDRGQEPARDENGRPRRPQVHFYPRFGAFVSNIQETTCSCTDDALRLIAAGSASRKTAPTAMNERSSRSHAIFTLRLERAAASNTIMLVDLAGREQERVTQCRTERFKDVF